MPPQQEKEKLSVKVGMQSYWHSPEARIVFNPDKDEDVLTAINRCIEVLRRAVTTCDGYCHFIEDMRHDDNDDYKDDKKLTRYDTFNLRRKSLYLLNFMRRAKKKCLKK